MIVMAKGGTHMVDEDRLVEMIENAEDKEMLLRIARAVILALSDDIKSIQ